MGDTTRRVTSSICALEKALKAHLISLEAAMHNDSGARSKGGGGGGGGPHQQQHPVGRSRTQSILTLNRMSKKSTEEDQAIARSLKPPGKVVVRLRVVFLKIGTIDTIHDRYTAEILIQSKWHEPRLDGKNLVSEDVDWDQFWYPRLSVENAIGEPKETAHCSVSYGGRDWMTSAGDDLTVEGMEGMGRGGGAGGGGEGWRRGQQQQQDCWAIVCETRRITGAFFEFMELNKFPFDSQDLTVTVISDMDESELDLVEDKQSPSGVNVETFSCEQEWRLHPMVNVWYKTTNKKTSQKILRLPALCVAAKVSRRPQFFMWNIIVVMAVICSLAFVTFTVGLETPQSRLQLTFILLLTTVTFKFVVNKSLPRISYLTYMDKYILGTMFILCCVCVWHAIVGSVIYTNTKPVNSTTTTMMTTTKTTTTPIGATTTPLLELATTQSANPPTDHNQSGSTTLPQPFCPSGSGSATPTPPGEAAVLVDKIALGILGTAYVGFHIFFVVLITCQNKLADETRPNIEIEFDKDNPDMTSDAESQFEVGAGKNVIASTSIHAKEFGRS